MSLFVLSLAIPPAAAKIYPDDFMVPGQDMSSPSSSMDMPADDSGSSSSTPIFLTTQIPDGTLTRAEFIDVIATRLYDADAHDNCFADIAATDTPDFSLLFTDVPVDAPYATSVCVAMKNGLISGYGDGSFHPDQPITAAEAAAVFSRIALTPRMQMPKEAWYQRYMQAMRSVDVEFTLRPWDHVTGAELKHSLCVLAKTSPELDPLGEFQSC